MAEVKSDVRRKRPRVTAAELVAAAIDIVDHEGMEALTIRRLAEACGLSPMGVYRHVRDKEELLDRVVDAVVGPALDELHASGSWDEQVAELFRGCRSANLAHPGVALLCVLRPTPVISVARFFHRVLAALAEGGLEGPEAVHAFDTLLMFTFGSVLWQIPRSDTVRQRLIAVARGDEGAAMIADRAAELGRRDPEEYFEAGLQMILRGLRASGGAGS